MNIAYKGTFLREGLLENGHAVYDLDARNGSSLNEALNSFPKPVDLVVWELFGASSDIQALEPRVAPIAAYCVDTPLNEFWLKPLAKNFDYLFIDQPQCAEAFELCGASPAWLPLPAQKAYFQPPRPKKYDVTFIGTTNSLRAKRNNILSLIQSRLKINLMSGLSMAQTQGVFSESKIVLNENFFPGLTLRVIQGLSSGAAVFTEASPFGDDFGLEDWRDLVLYDPENILERLEKLLAGGCLEIGAAGREKCRELFSAGKIASEFISKINLNKRRGAAISGEDSAWSGIYSELLFAQRFGGNFTAPMRRLEALAASSSEKAADAHTLLGDIKARFKSRQIAEEHYKKALEIDPACLANIKLALLNIGRGGNDAALRRIIEFSRRSPVQADLAALGAAAFKNDMGSALLLAAADIYFKLGRRLDMGFVKKFYDPVPDTAFEAARMSWQRNPSSKALEIMLKCLRPHHLQGELLPHMFQGMKLALLSRPQALEAAKTAFEYYDRESAQAIMAALKKK